jgi:hypothetical protein
LVARLRVAAADVHQHQAHRPPDGRIGPAAVPEQADAMSDPHLLHHRPADHHQGRGRVTGRLQALDIEPLVQQRLDRGHDHRHVREAVAGHNGVGRDGLNGSDALARRD